MFIRMASVQTLLGRQSPKMWSFADKQSKKDMPTKNGIKFIDENKHFPCCNYFGNWQEIKTNQIKLNRWKTCNILESTAN